MRRDFRIGLIILWISTMLACNVPGAVTSTPMPTVTPTNLPTLSSLETAAPSATAPALTSTSTSPAQPSSTASPTVSQPTVASTSAGIDTVKIFLVATDDNGQSGDKIGCGDSIIAVERQIDPTQAPLRAALEDLLSIHDQFYGESGLLNALHQSNLAVGDITIDQNGLATIHLTGTLLSGGTCDDPRIIAQLTYTARQFSTVKDTVIYVNETPIQDLLSGQ